MESVKEEDEFRRIRLNERVEWTNQVISTYRENIGFYRERLDRYHHLLGRVGERLGEAKPEEPK
jgi:hypothetical protein